MANISNIQIENFKGITKLYESFESTPKYITGNNGAGKTSFLEAIRYALTGKTPTREDILRRGTLSGFVSLEFDDVDRTTVCRSFYKGKPTKVMVNGKASTAKLAQEIICSILGTNEDFLNLNTSSEVFRELFKGELGKFLLGFVEESFTPEKLFSLVCFSEKEKELLGNNLPTTFGLPDCDVLYNRFYDERAKLKAITKSFSNYYSESSLEKPLRSAEDIDKELGEIVAAEQIEKTQLWAMENYKKALSNYETRKKEISNLEAKIAGIIIDADYDPLEKEKISEKQQAAMSKKASAEGLVNTIRNNIAVFEKTLSSLNTNICPISAKLVCTTDKSAARHEFEELIALNTKALNEQNKLIASLSLELKSLSEAEANFEAKKKAVSEKESLVSALARAKKTLGEKPVEPVKVQKADISKKEVLQEEKKKLIAYEEFAKKKSEMDAAFSNLALYDGFVKKFAPKGVVYEAIISFYCDIFNEEICDIANAVGYKIEFAPQNGLSLSITTDKSKPAVSFDECSTGEQLIVSMLVQHLCNILSNCNIMLIDDFNELDENNALSVKRLIEELAINYATIVIAGTNLS